MRLFAITLGIAFVCFIAWQIHVMQVEAHKAHDRGVEFYNQP